MSMQWQKAITALLQEAKTIPLWGNAPAFPIDIFNQKLKGRFEIPDLHIESRHVDWISVGEWREGAGAKPAVAVSNIDATSGEVIIQFAPPRKVFL